MKCIGPGTSDSDLSCRVGHALSAESPRVDARMLRGNRGCGAKTGAVVALS